MKTHLLPEHAAALAEMRDELESSRLVVALVPQRIRTNEGGCVRVAVEKNAKWYRDFCADYPSARRRKNAAFDTRIKRDNTLRALAAMLRGDVRSVYSGHLLAIARHRAAAPSRTDNAIAAARRRLASAALFAS